MGFKTTPKYYLTKSLGDGHAKSIELSKKQLLDLSYGIIPFDVIEVIVEWLKKDNNE